MFVMWKGMGLLRQPVVAPLHLQDSACIILVSTRGPSLSHLLLMGGLLLSFCGCCCRGVYYWKRASREDTVGDGWKPGRKGGQLQLNSYTCLIVCVYRSR